MQEVRYRLFLGALFLVIAPTVAGSVLALSIVLLAGLYSLISGIMRWRIAKTQIR